MPRSFRHNLYLTLSTSKALAHAAARPGLSQSAVVEAALKAFLGGDEGLQAVLFRRLDAMTRQMQRHAHHTDLVLEALGLFVQSSFNAVPPVPPRDQAAQKAIGAKRFDAFVVELGKRIAGGHTLGAEVSSILSANAENAPANDAALDEVPHAA
jgi:hypothetical protein